MNWPFGDLPLFGFDVILADPPWFYETWGEQTARGTPYTPMTTDDIKAMPVGHLASRNAILFLWGTWPLLPETLDVMAAWGFTYGTCGFDWAKQTRSGRGWHMGLGFYTRANTEFCLIGTTGQPGRPADMGVRQLIVEPVRQHSRKPDRIHDDIERLYPGRRYLELFARRSERPGWTFWGNETTKFNTAKETDHAEKPEVVRPREAPPGGDAGRSRTLFGT